jgi:heme oxygenase (biliverdin-IX-beta and delta-forming)
VHGCERPAPNPTANYTHDSAFSISDSFTFLEIIAAALLPLEAALVSAHVERLFPDWGRRSRSEAILADIARVGGIVRPSPALEPLGSGSVLGTMYVLEGSRLGAKAMLRQVLQSQHPEVHEGSVFLSHGSGSNLWQSFDSALELHGLRSSDDRPVVGAARRAFGLFAAAASTIALPAVQRAKVDA